MHDATRLALIILAIALATSATAATYKWVDKDGKVHYSDTPVPGATKVDLKPLTEIPGTPLAEPGPSEPEARDHTPMDKPTQYTVMSISSPADGSTVRPGGEALAVTVELQPPLGGGDRVVFTVDGVEFEGPITGLERGTHTLGARVADPDGATKISAPPVTIHVMQAIVKKPVKKPPKK